MLENFVAYTTQSDPSVVALHISEERVWAEWELTDAELETPPIPPEPHDHPWATVRASENDIHDRVRKVREYLDENEYARTPHVYFELILAGGNERLDIHQITRDDVALDDGTIEVPFDTDAIVVDAGLVTRHAITLTEYTTHVIQTYLTEHRVEKPGVDALFCGEAGRMSETTLNDAFGESVAGAGFDGVVEPYQVARAAGVPGYVEYPRTYRW